VVAFDLSRQSFRTEVYSDYKANRSQTPTDFKGQVSLVQEVLTGYMGDPRIAAFWAPRFGRFAEWFAATETARRAGVSKTVAEAQGELVLEAPAGPFVLTARADRIDVSASGLIITDYKSSQTLDNLRRQAEQGSAPQLPLEAAIAAAGGFSQVPAAAVAGLRHISTSGGEPPGQEIAIDGDPMARARTAQDGLARLIAQFDRESTPYRALRRARFQHKYKYDVYAHLARFAEWSDADDEEED